MSLRSQKSEHLKSLVVAVLMGGTSSEREISLLSGSNVADALASLGHQVHRMDVNPADLGPLEALSPDVAFVALHGAFGEDGEIQERMEEMGIVYTGSGPEASRLAMEKVLSKRRFLDSGLHTPQFRAVERGDLAMADEAFDLLGPRVVVKPTAEGSSIGVTMPADETEYLADVKKLWAEHDCVLVERLIEGRELTVGILAEKALPIIELKPPEKFYDYHAKYLAHETQYLTQVDLPADVYRRVQEAGERAHKALGCRDFSRVDLIASADGTPYVLEVNTIPGFTKRSLLPMAAEAAGIDFPHLCQRILALALARGTADCARPMRAATGHKDERTGI